VNPQGALAPGIDIVATAHVIHTTIRGMRISAKAGADAFQLDATVAFNLNRETLPGPG
jgi:hypothetical protein